MRRSPILITWTAVAAIVGLAGAAHAVGTVEVKFIEPEKFADAGRGAHDIEQTTKTLAAHFQSLAKRLPDGQALRLEITNVDLAGEIEPTRRGQEIRVLRGRADWPRMELRYTLLQGQQTLRSGQSRLADMGYMQAAINLDKNESLAYERRMIERWFADTIISPTAAK